MPILVDEAGQIITGNGRILPMKSLERTEMPWLAEARLSLGLIVTM